MKNRNLLFSLKLSILLFLRNKKTSVFTILIFSLILTLPTLTKSITDGFGLKIKKEVYNFIGDVVIKSDSSIKKDVYNKLNHLPFVDFYIPVYATSAIIEDKNGNEVGTKLLIVGKFDKFVEINRLRDYLIKGNVETGKKGIILGKELTNLNKLHIYPNPIDVEPGSYLIVKIKNKSFKVKYQGIYSKGLPSLDTFAITSFKTIPIKANKVMVFLKKEYKNNKTVEKILKNEFNRYTISTIKSEMATIDSFLRTFSIISSLTFFFGTIIAIIIIYALISINVKNKRTEIGILRALGIKEKYLVLTYLSLTTIYLLFSFLTSLVILKVFEEFFKIHPINSPFGLIVPFIDYHFFILNFIKLSLFLILVSYLPVKEVVREDLINQIRS